MNGESVASLIETQQQAVLGILWTHLTKKQFSEFQDMMLVIGRCSVCRLKDVQGGKWLQRPLELQHVGMSVLHDMLKFGPVEAVDYLVKRHSELLSDPVAPGKSRFPSVWQPPLHYLCRIKASDQLAKLKVLLAVCSLDLDKCHWSPVHYLVANEHLPAVTKLELLKLMKQVKGKEAVRAAVCHKEGMGYYVLSFSLREQCGPLFTELLEMMDKLPTEEVGWKLGVEDPLKTAIIMKNSEAVSQLQDKGVQLIRPNAVSAFVLGSSSSDTEIRVKILAWVRVRHSAYFSQVLLPELEIEATSVINLANFTFATLRRNLSMQTDLDVFRVLAMMTAAGDFEEVPNVLAQILKTTQPAGLVPELLLLSSLLAVSRRKLEVLSPLFSLTKVKEFLESLLKGKQISVTLRPSQTLSDSAIAVLSELHACGVLFPRLEKKRCDLECLILWKRGLITFDISKVQSQNKTLARLLRAHPEKVWQQAVEFFKKHGKKVEASYGEGLLLLTAKQAFDRGDAQTGSQLLLDWVKMPPSTESTEETQRARLLFSHPASLLPSLARLCSSLLKPPEHRWASSSLKATLRFLVMSSVPQVLSFDLWKPWEKYFVSCCEKRDEAMYDLLSATPLTLFQSMYAALSMELKEERKFAFGLFALKALHGRGALKDKVELMKGVFESVAALHHRGPQEDWGAEGWVCDLIGFVRLQELVDVSGMADDDVESIDVERVMDRATEDNLVELVKRQIATGDFTVKTSRFLRTIRTRSLWTLLKSLFFLDLRDEKLQRSVQEEYLLHLVSTSQDAELAAALPHCTQNLRIHRIAQAAPERLLKEIVIHLNYYSCSRSFTIPVFASDLSSMSADSKFVTTTRRSDLAFLTLQLLPLVENSEDSLVAGLRNLVRHGRSEDFGKIVGKLQSAQDYFDLWEGVRQTGVRNWGRNGGLVEMAKALIEASANTSLHILVFCGGFEMGLLEIPQSSLHLVLKRAWTADEIALLIDKAAFSLSRLTNPAQRALFSSLCFSSLSKIVDQQTSLFTSDLSSDLLYLISDTDTIELLTPLKPVLQFPDSDWKSVCEKEIKRGHAAHLRVILQFVKPWAELVELACKSRNSSELVQTLLRHPVEITESAQKTVLERGKLELIRLLLTKPLSPQQAGWLLLSNSKPALEAYKAQIAPCAPSLITQLEIVKEIVKQKRFESLSFLIDLCDDKRLMATALQNAVEKRNILFSILGFAPAICVEKVKATINDKRLWQKLMLERDEDGLTPVHNLLGAHVSQMSFGGFEGVSVRQVGFENVFSAGACVESHPLLNRLSDKFRQTYQQQYELHGFNSSKHTRTNPLREAPIYILMSHLLALKMTGEPGRNFLVGKEQKFLQVHDSVCRLQFLSAIGYPLSEKLLKEAVKSGLEDPALFLVGMFFTVANSEKPLIKAYKKRQVVLPKQFLRLISKTFSVVTPPKSILTREIAVDLLLLCLEKSMPYLTMLLSRTHPDICLNAEIHAQGITGPPLLILLATGQSALFTILAEQFISHRQLTQVQLSHLLSLPDTAELTANMRLSFAAVRLELTRRDLLPAGSLSLVLDALGKQQADLDFDLDAKADKFIDNLHMAIAHAESLRSEVKTLKEKLACGGPESPAQVEFAMFEAEFQRYQPTLTHFSLTVEKSLWDLICSKTKPWAPLYLASQLCSSTGLLGVYQQHSATQRDLHFVVGFGQPETKEIPGKGFRVGVKPLWVMENDNPYTVRLGLNYAIPCVYDVGELQDSLRHFSMNLNTSSGVTITSISVDSSLQLDDYEVLRKHVLQEPREDVCGLLAFELALQHFITTEDEYFHMSQPTFRLDPEDVHLIRSSSPRSELQLRSAIPDQCSKLNRMLNAVLKLECEITVTCVPYPQYAATLGYRVAVSPDRNVVWDFSCMKEYRLLKVRNAFHAAGLFESKIARYAHISLDCEALLQLFEKCEAQERFAEYLCEVARALVPLQLWFELEQFGVFFADIQSIFVIPEKVQGSTPSLHFGELEFSRFATTLLVHVPISLPAKISTAESSVMKRVEPAAGCLGLKALSVWMPQDLWQRTVIVSHLLASEDIDQGKQTYEWMDFFEYIERLLKAVDDVFGSFSKFQVISELDREHIKSIVAQRYPALWTPDITAPATLYQEWAASTGFLIEVRTAINIFLQEFGIRSADNLLQLGEQQLQALAGVGEAADDKSNMVLYRLVESQGKLKLQMDYFTIEAEKIPYSLSSIRRDPSELESQLSLSLQSFTPIFHNRHGAELRLTIELVGQLRDTLISAEEIQYQQITAALKLLLCEVKTAAIRTVTFSDMQQHLTGPRLIKRNSPSSLTVATAQLLASRLARISVDFPPKVAVLDDSNRTLQVALDCDAPTMTDVLVKSLSAAMRRTDPAAIGEDCDIRALALLSARSLVNRRQLLAAKILDTIPGTLQLHLAQGAACHIEFRSKALALTLSSQHGLDCFLPQVSDVVLGIRKDRGWKCLRKYVASAKYKNETRECFANAPLELDETEADLRPFYRVSGRRKPLDGAEFAYPDLRLMYPPWVAVVMAKDRSLKPISSPDFQSVLESPPILESPPMLESPLILGSPPILESPVSQGIPPVAEPADIHPLSDDSDDMEVRFQSIAQMRYDPQEHEGKDDEPLLSDRDLGSSPEELQGNDILRVDPLRSPKLEPIVMTRAHEEGRKSNRVVPAMVVLPPLEETKKDLRASNNSELFTGSQTTALPSKFIFRDYQLQHGPLTPSLQPIFDDCTHGARLQHLKLVVSAADLPHVAFLLTAVPTIDTLDMEVTGEPGAGFSLSGNTNLTVVNILQQEISSISLLLAIVRRSPHLQSLSLDNCGLGDFAWQELSKTISQAPGLQQLSLQGNGLTEDSAPSLAAVLESCPKVRISLQGNRVKKGLRRYRDRVELGQTGCGCCEIL